MTEFENLVLRKLDAMSLKIDAGDKRLSDHMADEESKIDHMGEKFVDLQRSVDAFSAGVNALVTEVQEAFIEHPSRPGKRDYAGHYNDHLLRKRWSDRWWSWVADGTGNLVKVAMASGAVWFLYHDGNRPSSYSSRRSSEL